MAQGIEDFSLYNISGSSSDEKSSLLYTLLPKIVRTRLRKMPSLRRSMSQYAIGSYDASPNESRRSSRGYSDLPTPPPEYRSRISLSEPVSDAEDLDEDLPMRPLSSCSASSSVDNDSGIKWKFSNQGLSLLNISASEDSKRPRSARQNSTSLSRQLYVHGLTYLLRGLPSDLTADEKISVWSAIPPDVQLVSPLSTSSALIQTANRQGDSTSDPENPSLLQRTVATFIVQLFILFQFLLPYIRFCLAILYKYERQHRIMERVVASSIQSCEELINTGLQVTNKIYRMNDGKVGQAVNDLAVWWIKGVTGGIHQGVGDGLVVLGVDVGAAGLPGAVVDKTGKNRKKGK